MSLFLPASMRRWRGEVAVANCSMLHHGTAHVANAMEHWRASGEQLTAEWEWQRGNIRAHSRKAGRQQKWQKKQMHTLTLSSRINSKEKEWNELKMQLQESKDESSKENSNSSTRRPSTISSHSCSIDHCEVELASVWKFVRAAAGFYFPSLLLLR